MRRFFRTSEKAPDLRYADPSHEAFNRKLTERHKPKLAPVDPGPSRPNPRGNTVLGRSFDRKRHPDIAKQLDDLKLTEAQRRERNSRKEQYKEARTKGSGMIKRDRPAPELRMKGAAAKGVDRRIFAKMMQQERDDAQSKVRVRVKTVTKTKTTSQSAGDSARTKTSTQTRREQFKTIRNEALRAAQEPTQTQGQGQSQGSGGHGH